MIRTIREHHALNGLRFSIVEFFLTAAVAGALAVSAAVSGGPLLAVLLCGVGLNCLAVAALSIAWLRAGEPDRPLSGTFSSAARARVLERHPGVQRATWLLAGVTLVAYLVLALVLVEYRRG